MTMVETIMRAMSTYADQLPETSCDAPFVRSHRKGLALAVLRAMREATNNMCEAGSVGPMERPSFPIPAITTSQADAAWTAMIDAAILEARANLSEETC